MEPRIGQRSCPSSKQDESRDGSRVGGLGLTVSLLLLSLWISFPAGAIAPGVEVSWVSGALPGWTYDVAIAENYAYLAVTSGMLILNISEPTEPTKVAFLGLPGYNRVIEIDKNYAYVVDERSGLHIVEVTDPANPKKIGNLAISGSPQRVAVAGDFAYLTDDAGGLRIINVSDPSKPFEAGIYKIRASSSVNDVAVNGHLVYVAYSGDGLRIIDVSDPTNPFEVGSYYSPKIKRVTIDGEYAYISADGFYIINISDPTAPVKTASYANSYYAWSVVVIEDFAYLGEGQIMGMRVIDISNRTYPQEISTLDTYQIIPGHANDVEVAGNYAYLGHLDGGLQVVNISVPHNPQIVGSYETPGSASSVTVDDTYAYVADGSAGLRIVDISNPEAPLELGTYDTPGWAVGVTVYNGYVLVADREEGLRIINVTDPNHPQEAGFYDTPGRALDVTVSNNYAYVADESKGLRVIDISDPSNPFEAGCYINLLPRNDTDPVDPDIDVCKRSFRGAAMEVFVVGNYAYLAYSNADVQIIDISDPTNPTLVGKVFNSPGYDQTITVSGDYAYVGTFNRGLNIIEVSEPTNPFLAGSFMGSSSIRFVDIEEDYAYGTGENGLVIIDITDQINLSIAGTSNITLPISDAVVYGDYILIASGETQLQILKISNLTLRAAILSITPDRSGLGSRVTFTGTGVDPVGTIVAYEWASSIDGLLSNQATFSTANLSVGTHTITFRVQNEAGDWSRPAMMLVQIYPPPDVDDIRDYGNNDTFLPGPGLTYILIVIVGTVVLRRKRTVGSTQSMAPLL